MMCLIQAVWNLAGPASEKPVALVDKTVRE